ncbi:MAG: ketol-acid reductoisomerase (NADP(+)) [Candidatus Hydrogenedentota bacterium]
MGGNGGKTRFFSSRDRIPNALAGERVAVVGYGHLGQPFARNLRDSGVANLVIGNIEDGYAETARRDGFDVLPIKDAVAQATVSLILLPDEVVPEVFPSDLAPSLQPASAIVFASGYTLAFDLIRAPADVDVLLVAPRMGGEQARERYLEGRGFYAYVSVERDASGKAWTRLLGLADAVGILKAGALELNAWNEAILDLYIEQSVGAMLGTAMLTAFATAQDAGIPPEALVMEMYMSEEMETVWRSFREKGFFRASHDHGPTAMFGGYIRSMEFMASGLSDTFNRILDDIRSGRFAKQFDDERREGYPQLSIAQAMSNEEGPMAEAEKWLRETLRDRANA